MLRNIPTFTVLYQKTFMKRAIKALYFYFCIFLYFSTKGKIIGLQKAYWLLEFIFHSFILHVDENYEIYRYEEIKIS
jgi:hypothetical protein